MFNWRICFKILLLLHIFNIFITQLSGWFDSQILNVMTTNLFWPGLPFFWSMASVNANFPSSKPRVFYFWSSWSPLFALQLFTWKITNLSNIWFGKKKGHITFQATKLASELTNVRFPNFEIRIRIRNTNYAWKIKRELRVVLTMLNMCLFPKTIV